MSISRKMSNIPAQASELYIPRKKSLFEQTMFSPKSTKPQSLPKIHKALSPGENVQGKDFALRKLLIPPTAEDLFQSPGQIVAETTVRAQELEQAAMIEVFKRNRIRKVILNSPEARLTQDRVSFAVKE